MVETAAGRMSDSVVDRRVRVREIVPGRPTFESIGLARALNRDSIRLEEDQGRIVSVALSPAVQIEISRGMKSNAGRGTWMGALIGGAGGGLIGALSCDGPGGLFYPSSSDCALGGALFGGVGGALLGLGFGALVKTERWEPVSLDETGRAHRRSEEAP